MATSGVYALELTLNGLLEQAYGELQIGQDGETLSAGFYNKAKPRLNTMLKTWEAQGIHLWTMEEGVLFLDVGVAEYPFSTAKVANTYYETTLDADEAIGQTTLSVASTANMAVDMPIGVIGTDNDLQWSTIASFVTNDTVTINDALTVAATSGAQVYYYPTTTFKPVSRILNVRRKEGTAYEVPINYESRDYYMSLPNKTNQGYPVVAYYSRQIPTGTMYVWNAPSSAVPVIRFTYERQIQIMSSSTDTFDVPEYWYEAIKYNLAKRLIPVFGCGAGRAALIADLAKETLDTALSFDTTLYPITVNMSRS